MRNFMVILSIMVAGLLTGCYRWMSHEEYTARNEWCRSRGLKPAADFLPYRRGGHHPNPSAVFCIDEQGNIFKSEYKNE